MLLFHEMNRKPFRICIKSLKGGETIRFSAFYKKRNNVMKFSNENIPVREENKPCLPKNLGVAYSSGEKVPCRDPFILPYDGKYYLYQTANEKGIVCLISDDLKTWAEPITVYSPPENFHGYDCWFWAPECHYYNGYFYIFTSVKSKKYDDHRVISVYRANNPLGPFEDIANGCISPSNWDAIDGTLYIDKEGNPWMVFVHEWTSMPDHNGSMVAARLSEDFTKLVSEPIHLFFAKDASWHARGVTDGPFLYRTNGGELLMIWSNFSEKGYAVGIARSENGEINGRWIQQGLLYQEGLQDNFTLAGGHAMIFKKLDGELAITLHCPNDPVGDQFEHVVIFDLIEENGKLSLNR